MITIRSSIFEVKLTGPTMLRLQATITKRYSAETEEKYTKTPNKEQK